MKTVEEKIYSILLHAEEEDENGVFRLQSSSYEKVIEQIITLKEKNKNGA